MFSKLKMLEVIRLTVGQLKSNCYLLFDNESKETLVIDPGDDAQFLIRKIEDNNLTPKLVLATHGHFDHIMAANEIKLGYDIPFMMSKDDRFLLERMRDTAKYFVKTDPGPAPKIDRYLKENDTVKVGGYGFSAFKTPGHTPGGFSFYQEKEKLIFVGDVVFEDGLFGRTDFSYSNSGELQASVKKITDLPEETTVYSGHGEETNIKKLRVFLK